MIPYRKWAGVGLLRLRWERSLARQMCQRICRPRELPPCRIRRSILAQQVSTAPKIPLAFWKHRAAPSIPSPYF